MLDKAALGQSVSYPFSLDEYQDRLARVRSAMQAKNIDLLLVTGPENIYYLTGYRTTGYYIYQALVVPLSGDPQFVVRKLEFPNVQALSWIKSGHQVADTENPLDATAACIQTIGGARARVRLRGPRILLPAAILDGLRERLSQVPFVPASGVVEGARMIKSPREIEYVRLAAAAAVAGIEAGFGAIRPGRTENEVAGAVYAAMVGAGSEYPSSQPYVVTGPRSALGHASFERKEIKSADIVFMEVGGSWFRYGGAIMRTLSVGPPSPELRKAANAVLGALDALLAAVRPGVTSGEIDRAGRSVVEKAGLDQYWLHRTGYSIGIGFRRPAGVRGTSWISSPATRVRCSPA